MKTLPARIMKLPWTQIQSDLLEKGFAMIPKLLSAQECATLRKLFGHDDRFRSTIDMKRYNFGKGTYRYFGYPLPDLVQSLRKEIYRGIRPAAETWSERTKYGAKYPATFANFQREMKLLGQTRSTPLILKYETGDYNCLHQDISNDLIFPYQVVLGLSQQGSDYDGGHLLLTQSRPRMQTIPFVIAIPKGGAVIFSSNFHPQQGKRGYYRTVFKHGVGHIERGERYTLGIVFHDYKEKS